MKNALDRTLRAFVGVQNFTLEGQAASKPHTAFPADFATSQEQLK